MGSHYFKQSYIVIYTTYGNWERISTCAVYLLDLTKVKYLAILILWAGFFHYVDNAP
jgi:hypothetical protein